MANIYDMTDTWNNGATTFTAIKMDVSDSASAANSLLLDLKVDGVTKASIDKAGNLTANVTLTSIDNVPIGATTPSAGTFTSLTASGDVNFDSNTLFVDASANAVGIGTSSLSSGLRTVIQGSQAGGAPQTSGTTQTYGLLRLQGTGFTAALDFGTNGGNYAWIQSTDQLNLGTNYPLVLNPNGSNVGIGVSSPASTLDIFTPTNYGLRVSDGTYTGVLVPSALGGLAYGTTSNHPSIFLSNNAERMRIDSAGTLITNHNIREKIYNLTGTDINPVNGSVQYKTLAATTTFTESLADGDSVILRLAGGDTYAVTWPTMTWVTSAGNTAPTLGGSDVVVLWQESSTVYGAYVGSYA